MGYDLDDEAVDADEPRWLILKRGKTRDEDAGFRVYSLFGRVGREVQREAQERYGRALSAGGATADSAAVEQIAFKCARLIAEVKNVEVGGRALAADYDQLFDVFRSDKFLTVRGKIIMHAQDIDRYGLTEADAGN